MVDVVQLEHCFSLIIAFNIHMNNVLEDYLHMKYKYQL